ncbi:Clp protease ClpP [Flavobacterium sp. F-65]|uniref:Clp protease ClpP n=1 Tax=Flavobacterium pisciphilum TaxID=2893755 RepID=A0ABS8MUJ0_9FLAO|nr:Clp protease ClpP [Flavobacterium sp. F-65]MCC9072460.1 Clp protease ClpP [Flavobacterium sp. F-65]
MNFLVKQNTITAYGQIWDGDGMEFVSIFSQMEGQYNDIDVKLHTYGGSVFDGNLIYNTIQNSKNVNNIDIIGIAASMGAIISQSRKKKPRMVRNGYLMIHAPSGSTHGNANDHENTGKLLRSIEKNFKFLLVDSTGKSESYVSKWMTGDNWFDAEQSLKEGLISEIIEPESDTLMANLNPKELGAQGMYYQFTALLTEKETSHIKLDNDMKKPIIEALGLQGVTAESSDTAIIDAVRNHYEGKITKAEADVKAANEKTKALEEKLAIQGKAAITAEIEAAKKAGKITQDQVATYEGIATASGVEVLKTVLAAIPARQSITGQMQGNGGKNNAPVGRENWDFDKWQKEDPKGFEALAKEEPETFQEILKAKYKK